MTLDRVVVIHDTSAPTGGAEIMALQSAEAMAEVGIPVTFITGDAAEACKLDRSRIEVISIDGTPISERVSVRNAAVGLFNSKTKAALDRFIAERDTPGTVYHLHNWTKILSPSVFLALRPVASRLFITAHDFSLVCPTIAYSNYQKGGEACPLTPLSRACITTNCDRASYLHKLWRVIRSAERKIFLDIRRKGALVGIIHPEIGEYYTRGGVPPEQLRVVRNPVSPYSETRIAAENNSDLFFVGRVVHEKGVDLAVEAARRIGRRLRVIGDGDLREQLAAKYPEVVFEGWRTHQEISALMQEARTVLVTSRLPEGFTLVAHEAMRSGIPVVAFSDVDCKEASELGGAIAVPPRAVESLVEGLQRLESDDAVAVMSKIAFAEGYRFSNTRASWREAMLSHYRELLARSRHGLTPGANPANRNVPAATEASAEVLAAS
jgi:glycosyltransferase involved in cell wall biosynthesis